MMETSNGERKQIRGQQIWQNDRGTDTTETTAIEDKDDSNRQQLHMIWQKKYRDGRTTAMDERRKETTEWQIWQDDSGQRWQQQMTDMTEKHHDRDDGVTARDKRTTDEMKEWQKQMTVMTKWQIWQTTEQQRWLDGRNRQNNDIIWLQQTTAMADWQDRMTRQIEQQRQQRQQMTTADEIMISYNRMADMTEWQRTDIIKITEIEDGNDSNQWLLWRTVEQHRWQDSSNGQKNGRVNRTTDAQNNTG